MSEVIEDGTGRGFKAKVDSNKRLHVDSSGRSQDQQAALLGDSYNVNTGTITLTSANESGIFYLKYTGDNPLVIKEILAIIGSTTNGTGDGEIVILKNPTTGTVISDATVVETASNRDFSSANTLEALVYKGAEAKTLTNGDVFASSTRSSFGAVVAFDASIMVLRKGNSIGVKYTPPSGNTSQTIKIAVTCFVEDSELDL